MKTIEINKNEYLIYGFEREGCHVVPPHFQPDNFGGDTLLWLLPRDKHGQSKKISCGEYSVHTEDDTAVITFDGEIREEAYPAVPCCDFFGSRFVFDLPHGEIFEKTFAEFYWNNQLNQMAERTFLRDNKDIREGYVLSTQDTGVYAGTYLAVDHEFHMKGRFAVGGQTEAELIRRMLRLQIKIMREDDKGLYRNVCAVQPDDTREYDVWRYSEDGQTYAQMFRVTANIEFVEGLYNYYSMTKDRGFVETYLEDTEKSCAYIERFITPEGFLDSHVFYEDQVMKDFTVLQAQLFAARSFLLMSRLETLLGRNAQAEHYRALYRRLGEKAVRPYPEGFWDPAERRFIDWIDAKGEKHDRIHLLANELPELFGFANAQQIDCCRKVIKDHSDVFDKFPSYVAAKIEDYTPGEIGDGGPYDLCAAGRYWCWDAAYLAHRKDGKKLLRQLLQVYEQAEKDGYLMGERYDMNYVYYNTGADAARNWHGAARYYEYPNVWIYVLICQYLGVRHGFDCDIVLEPLFENGTVSLPTYGISFTVKDSVVIQLQNLSAAPLTVRIPAEDRIETI